ncbi:MAG: response regulator [Woeseiaceae bacterium]
MDGAMDMLNYTVLYVEDNPANLRLVETIMKKILGVEFFSAPEALLGLELAEQRQPDLILMDINLPGMDGYQALIKIKQMDSLKNTPTIAISANAMASDIEKGLQAGFDSYITKPIDVKAFIVEIKKYLKEYDG